MQFIYLLSAKGATPNDIAHKSAKELQTAGDTGPE
jgi:hypothetical protein